MKFAISFVALVLAACAFAAPSPEPSLHLGPGPTCSPLGQSCDIKFCCSGSCADGVSVGSLCARCREHPPDDSRCVISGLHLGLIQCFRRSRLACFQRGERFDSTARPSLTICALYRFIDRICGKPSVSSSVEMAHMIIGAVLLWRS